MWLLQPNIASMLLLLLPIEVVTVAVQVEVVVVIDVVVEDVVIGVVIDFLTLLFFLPPPTGTLRRVPPLVQCLLQALQKWRG